MEKKITIIHTTSATLSSIPELITENYGDYFEITNILDDSLLNDIKANNKITKKVISRFVQYVNIAQQHDSVAVLVACSSVGEATNIARKIIDIPIFKIDEPMAEKAADEGEKILVLGTVQSTLKPTVDLIQQKIDKTSKNVESFLIPNVFKLHSTDLEQHNKKIAEVVIENQEKYDVIVLAQASMSGAKKLIDHPKALLLTSLPLGLYQLREIIN